MNIIEGLFWAFIGYYMVSSIKSLFANSSAYRLDRIALLHASIKLHEGNVTTAMKIIDDRLEEEDDE